MIRLRRRRSGTAPRSMQVVAVDGGAGPSTALRLTLRKTPAPKPSEVLIRLAGAGVNRVDLMQREGGCLLPPGSPETLGLEISGAVAAVGSGVQRFRIGDPVCALLSGGGYAEYVAVDASHVLPAPPGVDQLLAAGLPEAIFMIYANVFESGKLKADETLLVHDPAAGAGALAIAMAKAAGARVIATGANPEEAVQATAMGADLSIDTSHQDFVEVVRGEGGVDVILDMVGGDRARRNLEALKGEGRLCQIALPIGAMITIDLGQGAQQQLTIDSPGLRNRSAAEKSRLAGDIEARVWPWFASGRMPVQVDKIFPLARAGLAPDYLASAPRRGKVILCAPHLAISGRRPWTQAATAGAPFAPNQHDGGSYGE